jgi:hypothetical protein
MNIVRGQYRGRYRAGENHALLGSTNLTDAPGVIQPPGEVPGQEFLTLRVIRYGTNQTIPAIVGPEGNFGNFLPFTKEFMGFWTSVRS